MADRQVIIDSLEGRIIGGEMHHGGYIHVPQEEAEQIIGLLKEQEAVEPRVSTAEQRRGHCNKVIEMDGWKVCPWCGKMIDWERWWQKNGTCNQDT